MEMVQLVPKAGVGVVGSLTAMTINDWVGLLVGILTAIFMAFQIEAAYRKRKIAIQREKELLEKKE